MTQESSLKKGERIGWKRIAIVIGFPVAVIIEIFWVFSLLGQ